MVLNGFISEKNSFCPEIDYNFVNILNTIKGILHLNTSIERGYKTSYSDTKSSMIA